MCFCAAQNEIFTMSHGWGGQLARIIVGADTSVEHCVPTPKRLFPKRLAPGEHTIFDHSLIAAPDVVDENADGASLPSHERECSSDLFIVPVVTANASNSGIVRFIVLN